jgi:hypothetical protein
MWGLYYFIKFKNTYMKKNMKMYSKEELNTMQEMAKQPVSTTKLARKLAKQFNRTYGGVYAKLLFMRRGITVEAKIAAAPKTPVLAKSHTISNRPTKIEISDAGMTFYF